MTFKFTHFASACTLTLGTGWVWHWCWLNHFHAMLECWHGACNDWWFSKIEISTGSCSSWQSFLLPVSFYRRLWHYQRTIHLHWDFHWHGSLWPSVCCLFCSNGSMHESDRRLALPTHNSHFWCSIQTSFNKADQPLLVIPLFLSRPCPRSLVVWSRHLPK